MKKEKYTFFPFLIWLSLFLFFLALHIYLLTGIQIVDWSSTYGLGLVRIAALALVSCAAFLKLNCLEKLLVIHQWFTHDWERKMRETCEKLYFRLVKRQQPKKRIDPQYRMFNFRKSHLLIVSNRTIQQNRRRIAWELSGDPPVT